MTNRTSFALGVVLLSSVVAVMPPRAEEPAGPAGDLRSARDAMTKWVETQQVISKERKEWQEGKLILQSRIELMKGEIAALQEKIDDLKDAGAEARLKMSEVESQSDSLKASSTSLAGWVGAMEQRLRLLRSRLPEPVQERVHPLYSRMPEDPDSTKASVAERYQNVVGILNEVNKFNNEIALVTEVRTLSDGKPAEVRTVYLGLAQAYYVSARGEAGVGRPGETDGWHWQPDNDLAPQILEVVDVLQNKATPKFIPLPVKVQ